MLLKSLEILNMRKVRQAVIEFHGPGVQVIQGANMSGKTTIGQSVALTMNGAKEFTPGMITHGEEKAEIIALTDDGLEIKTVVGVKVEQTVKQYDENLLRYEKVSGGVRTFLASLCSGLEMPWALRDMTDAKIIELVKNRSGVDEKIAVIDAELKKKEDTRTEVGRDKKRLGEPAPMSEVKHPAPVDDIKAEREKSVEYVKSVNNEFARVSDAIRAMCNFKNLDDMRNAASKIETEAVRIETALAKNKAYSQADVDAFDKQLSAWYELDKNAAAYDTYIKNKNEWDRLTCLYDDFTKGIEDLREQRKKVLAEMKLGVKGLEVGDDNMLYHNGALRGITETNKTGNWSTAESVQVFFGLGARFAGIMKVLVVDNAESLDAKTTEVITGWAESAGFLVLMLRVAEMPETLEDGIIYVREGEVVTK
jgi:hypothetical protein